MKWNDQVAGGGGTERKWRTGQTGSCGGGESKFVILFQMKLG